MQYWGPWTMKVNCKCDQCKTFSEVPQNGPTVRWGQSSLERENHRWTKQPWWIRVSLNELKLVNLSVSDKVRRCRCSFVWTMVQWRRMIPAVNSDGLQVCFIPISLCFTLWSSFLLDPLPVILFTFLRSDFCPIVSPIPLASSHCQGKQRNSK